MTKLRRFIMLVIMVTMTFVAIEAQSPITSTYRLEAGGTSVADTYLSPITYHGARIALSGSWQKMMPANREHLSMQFDASLEGSFLQGNRKITEGYDASAAFSWGVAYLWRPVGNLNLEAGGAAGFDAGAIYLPGNGNNPADARARIGISLRAAASYGINLGERTLTLSDEVTIPSAGIFFRQPYGESYYEIYLGNRADIVHFGWWGNCFCINNLLSASYPLGSKSIVAGYRFRAETSYANSLNCRVFSHSFVLGLKF